MNSDDYEFNGYDQPLKGMERFRDDFQILYTSDRFSDKYVEAKKNVWEEMDAMYRNNRMTKTEQVKVQRLLEKNEEREAYDTLEQMLEE